MSMKFRIKDVMQSTKLQEALFLLGYSWSFGQKVIHTNYPFLYAENKKLIYGDLTKHFNNCSFTEHDPDEFIAQCAKQPSHKHAELIKLWADGAIIQWSNTYHNNEWVDCTNNAPSWDIDNMYRIKPAPTERVFPFTSMSGNTLYDAWTVDPSGMKSSLVNIANKAIKQYILDMETSV